MQRMRHDRVCNLLTELVYVQEVLIFTCICHALDIRTVIPQDTPGDETDGRSPACESEVARKLFLYVKKKKNYQCKGVDSFHNTTDPGV